MSDEIWKDIAGYEGMYQVSSMGRVRSLDRVVDYRRCISNRRGKIIAGGVNRDGYSTVNLSKDGVRKFKSVHRLVCDAFHEAVPGHNVTNHKDGNKLNNCAANLEHSTYSKNTQHAFDTGLQKPERGEVNGNSKLTTERVLEIRRKYETGKYSKPCLAKDYEVTRQQIGHIVSKKHWTHI